MAPELDIADRMGIRPADVKGYNVSQSTLGYAIVIAHENSARKQKLLEAFTKIRVPAHHVSCQVLFDGATLNADDAIVGVNLDSCSSLRGGTTKKLLGSWLPGIDPDSLLLGSRLLKSDAYDRLVRYFGKLFRSRKMLRAHFRWEARDRSCVFGHSKGLASGHDHH